MFMVHTTYIILSGYEDLAVECFIHIMRHAQQEPGTLLYTVRRSPDDPRHFFLYESYTDQEAFTAHCGSIAFWRYVTQGLHLICESHHGERGEFPDYQFLGDMPWHQDKKMGNDPGSFLDPNDPAETARLLLQDRMVTYSMHGLFPERSDLGDIHAILDVGCGPGGWALDVAHAYPDRRVVGIDISTTMVTYAQAHAIAGRLGNVQFIVQDALQSLESLGTFDLVNVRLAMTFVPRAYWPTFLGHCLDILRPGGILRITEGEAVPLTNSLACEKMNAWAAQMLYERGYGFSSPSHHLGILPWLDPLLQDVGVGCVHTGRMPHLLDFSYDTILHDSQYQNHMVWTLLMQSQLLDDGITTEEEFTQTYQRMLEEIQRPLFRGIWNLLTLWWRKPQDRNAEERSIPSRYDLSAAERRNVFLLA